MPNAVLPCLLLVLAFISAPAHAAPLCLPEATAAALAHLGAPADARAIARDLPVHQDGVDLFDLRLWLPQHHFQALVLQPQPELLQRLILAGFPLIIIRDQPEGRHAVALHSGSAKGVTIVDNLASQQVNVPWPLALSHMHVALIIWQPQKPLTQKHAGSKKLWRDLVQLDAEFLSTGWLRRAAEHPKPNEQALFLAAEAIRAAPCFARAREVFAQILAQLQASDFTRKLVAGLVVCR